MAEDADGLAPLEGLGCRVRVVLVKRFVGGFRVRDLGLGVCASTNTDDAHLCLLLCGSRVRNVVMRVSRSQCLSLSPSLSLCRCSSSLVACS